LFESVRAQVANHAPQLLDTARAWRISMCMPALPKRPRATIMCVPEIVEDATLDIRSGRHPVVEAASKEPFVPNDCVMDTEAQQVLIITGPNASGKSTYLRQVALIALMAQIGSFVPARAARIGWWTESSRASGHRTISRQGKAHSPWR
jgi:DNA mismatch repair protein MutS